MLAAPDHKLSLWLPPEPEQGQDSAETHHYAFCVALPGPLLLQLHHLGD